MTNTFHSSSPGRPMICLARNLPAFETERDLRQFFARLPAVTVDTVESCAHCQGFHAVTHMRPPSGATSGSGREETGYTPMVPRAAPGRGAQFAKMRKAAEGELF